MPSRCSARPPTGSASGRSGAAVAIGLALACAVASLATGLVTVLVALSLLRAFEQGSFPLVGTLLVARSFTRRGQAMAIATFGLKLPRNGLTPTTPSRQP
jgi:hypothetical protein